ncbi:hypothetical protein BC833DRAFT_610196 [Globomyces pollinis-pini]|nr:hypothetical protein BC833DRAFT_610196 [Globomyces pollinis-pini]
MLAFLLNISLLLIKLYKNDQSATIDSRYFKSTQIIINENQSGLYWDLLEYLLIIVSFANAGILGFQSKSLILFHQPTAPQYPDSEFDTNWDLSKKTRNAQIVLVDNPATNQLENHWELRIWSPSEFSLKIFTWFSPLQVLLIHLSDNEQCATFILAAYTTSLTLWFVISSYQQLVMDSNILGGQLLLDSTGINDPIKFAVPPKPEIS